MSSTSAFLRILSDDDIILTDASSTTAAASVMLNVTAIGNSTAEVAQEAAEEADGILKIVTRIMAVVTILVVIAIIIGISRMPPVKKALTNMGDAVSTSFKVGCVRCRHWKKCCINVFCCGCLPFVRDKMGYESLYKADKSIRVSFLHVKNLKMTKYLYFEAWTEPEEAPRKPTNHFVGSPSVDLNSEMMELHWFDDEDYLCFGIIEYTGPTVGSHKPLGEARVSTAEVYKAMSASKTSGGIISVKLKEHDEVSIKKKVADRKTNATSPAPILLKQGIQSLQQTAYDKFGEEYPDMDEVDALRDENKKLRTRLERSGDKAADIPITQHKAKEPEDICELFVQIEVVSKKAVSPSVLSTASSMTTMAS